jgi:DNA-directed RNA polymerase specialized sigma24 family protein
MEQRIDRLRLTEMPKTRWTLIRLAAGSDLEAARKAVDALCQMYWLPVHSFFIRLECDPDEAKGLTQELLTTFVEKNHFARASPELGHLRQYLRAAARNLLRNSRRDRKVERRLTVPLEQRGGDGTWRPRVEPMTAVTPEDEFDFRWACRLVEEALVRLREQYRSDPQLFSKLQRYLAATDDDPPYAAMARELGRSVDAVRQAVHRMRRRYQLRLRDEVARYTEDAAVEQELAWLLTVAVRVMGG